MDNFLLFVFVFLIPSCLLVTCLEGADLLALFCVVFSCVFATLPLIMVSGVRCGILLYRLLLILAFFLTIIFTVKHKCKVFLCWYVVFEPWHELSNNVVCATSKGSYQPAHTRILTRAFASRLNIR